MNNTGYIKINSDEWGDAGKIYKVVDYAPRDDSTAVELTLLESDGNMIHRVIPYHWVEWIEDGDW